MRRDPMDSETRAWLIGIVSVVLIFSLTIITAILLVTHNGQRADEQRTKRAGVIADEVQLCRSLKSDSAITLCLSVLPAP